MAERRYTVLLYTAVLTAVVATFGVYRVLQSTRAKSQAAMRPVVVASKDLPEGTSLSASNLETKPWPASTIPAGAYPKPDSLLGRVTRVAVYKGEVMLPGRLAPAGTGPGLEVKITPGKRAMALKINDVAGISGLIQPNSRVDVVVSMKKSDANAAPVSKVFMQDMRVLSMGTTVDRDVDGKPITATTAALEVTPEQAERLAVATNEGSIQLVLRAFGDPDTVNTSGAQARDVIGRRAPVEEPAPKPKRVVEKPAPKKVEPPVQPVQVVIAPPPPPKPDSLHVTIYRGAKSDEQKFAKDSATKRPQ